MRVMSFRDLGDGRLYQSKIVWNHRIGADFRALIGQRVHQILTGFIIISSFRSAITHHNHGNFTIN